MEGKMPIRIHFCFTGFHSNELPLIFDMKHVEREPCLGTAQGLEEEQ